MGRRAGGRVWRLGEKPDAPWIVSNTPRHAQLEGFDLHANVAVPATDRARLEQLCRYLLRPAVSQDRLQLLRSARAQDGLDGRDTAGAVCQTFVVEGFAATIIGCAVEDDARRAFLAEQNLVGQGAGYRPAP